MSSTTAKKGIKKLILNTIKEDCEHREVISEFFWDLLERGSGNVEDFLLAYTGSFDPPKFNVGDKVRVNNLSMWNINWEASEQQGYSIDNNLFVKITAVYPYRTKTYQGEVTYINNGANVDSRYVEFESDYIVMDNTMVIGPNNKNIAALI